ncbi:class 1 fructose-bisphosphatase [Haloferax volcanii]|uniref:Fructose-1,6-bisphosphatase class 1 n=3 Tax=Haloferax volcanii TaxID=2246 RepID=A0A384LGJ7_HALVD|nr:fructose-bisphosphatase class I [Haloferax volcanii]ADE03906.1 fructose-1,6-bisphosphatase [Haloferax volcanii DS2]ELY33723.1 fructose-1,6-bisphosphatase [Haloferax volcanii DS2]MBS8119248.1 fructose-bisphosphatase class I [Haloferax volcanii]MBS8124261.1 fructose-bisphosphatase class I [Haloferax volcanii]MBS8128130.1 fructose-bisphosphatase class I [Haloferax volcanii]
MTDPSSREDDVVDAIVETLCAAAPSIRAGLPGRRVYEEGTNPSGERQLEADTYADELLLKRLRPLDGVGEYASEERPDVIDIGEGVSVALDPLDGSTNLKPNNVMGTLYSIYDEPLPTGGENLLAAGYILYGPVTTLVAGRDGVVSEYILESGIKRPLREELTLPGDPAIFSFGGRVNRWFDDFEAFARETERTEGMKLRYGGSMIGDVNQILHYGGVFAYPAQTDAPGGKLRQQFEGFPIGYIIECAGGRSSDGEQSLLSGTPEDIHDRVPVYIGNDSLVESLETRLD